MQSADGLQLDSYQLTVSRAAPPAEDASLSALGLEGLELSPAFNPATLSYQASAGNAVTQVTVSATPSDSGATALITPADADASTDVHELALSVGDNVVTVLVTAEDGVSTRSYTVTVRRLAPPSSDARLTSLSLDAAQLQPGFAPDVQQYTAALGWAVNRVTLSLTPAEAAAVVQVAPGDADPDSDGYQFALPPAEANGAALSTPVAIVVTAPDGVARRTYLLTLERAARPSGDASLASLTLAGLELMPAFGAQILSYEAAAGADVSQVTISAVANHADADLLIDPPDADPTTDEHEIDLLARTTSVTITVTAPDGVTTRTYALTISWDGAPSYQVTMQLPDTCELYDLTDEGDTTDERARRDTDVGIQTCAMRSSTAGRHTSVCALLPHVPRGRGPSAITGERHLHPPRHSIRGRNASRTRRAIRHASVLWTQPDPDPGGRNVRCRNRDALSDIYHRQELPLSV